MPLVKVVTKLEYSDYIRAIQEYTEEKARLVEKRVRRVSHDICQAMKEWYFSVAEEGYNIPLDPKYNNVDNNMFKRVSRYRVLQRKGYCAIKIWFDLSSSHNEGTKQKDLNDADYVKFFLFGTKRHNIRPVTAKRLRFWSKKFGRETKERPPYYHEAREEILRGVAKEVKHPGFKGRDIMKATVFAMSASNDYLAKAENASDSDFQERLREMVRIYSTQVFEGINDRWHNRIW